MSATRLWRRLRRRIQLHRGTHWSQKRLSPAQQDAVRAALRTAEPVELVDPMSHIAKRQARRDATAGLGTVTVEEITPEIEHKAAETFRRAALEHQPDRTDDDD